MDGCFVTCLVSILALSGLCVVILAYGQAGGFQMYTRELFEYLQQLLEILGVTKTGKALLQQLE